LDTIGVAGETNYGLDRYTRHVTTLSAPEHAECSATEPVMTATTILYVPNDRKKTSKFAMERTEESVPEGNKKTER
jgi:hypothetical protein